MCQRIISWESLIRNKKECSKEHSFLFCSGVWIRVIGETGEIIHAGIKRDGKFATLFKGVIPLAVFNFGIVTLVNSRQHLNLNLREPFAFS